MRVCFVAAVVVAMAAAPSCSPQQAAVIENFGKVPCQIVEPGGYIPPPIPLPPAECEQRKREAEAAATRAAQAYIAHPEPPAYQPTWKRVEADDGQVYLIDVGSLQSYVRSAGSAGILKGVFATIYKYTGPTYDPMNVQTVTFECPDYMTVDLPGGIGPSTYLAPRSVGRRLADIACAAPLKRN